MIEHRADFDDFTRVTLLKLFGFRIVLHIFKKDDHHPCHDHPYNILSILLWGSYIELTPLNLMKHKKCTWGKVRRALSVWWIPATHRHKILLDGEQRAVSLCFFGRKHRKWGFDVDGEWIESEEYFKKDTPKTIRIRIKGEMRDVPYPPQDGGAHIWIDGEWKRTEDVDDPFPPP